LISTAFERNTFHSELRNGSGTRKQSSSTQT
jgi:hypothetical protein